MQDRPENARNCLYDTDFQVWCREQARLVRERRFSELDVENVAEELESMGRSDRHQIRGRLEVLIAHLLKWRYQPGGRKRGWSATIHEQRSRIEYILEDSPSLHGFPQEIAADCYRAARLLASNETGIEFSLFPESCPFTADEIVDPGFMPEEPGLEEAQRSRER